MLNEQRRSVRLELNKGTLLVRYFGVPAFNSTLSDLSEDGCACVTIMDGMERAHIETWSTLLVPGFIIETEITVAPELISFHTEAEVRHVRQLNDHSIMLGLQFIHSDTRKTRLRSALLSIAAARCMEAERETAAPAEVDPIEWQSLQTTSSKASGRSTVKKLIGKIFSVHTRDRRSSISISAPAGLTAAGTSACRLLMQHRKARPNDVCQALAKEWSLPIAPLEQCEVPQKLQKLFSYLVLRRYEFIPFADSKERVCIAAAYPLPEAVVNELEQLCGQRLLVYLAPMDQIQQIQFKMRPRGPYQERHHARVRIRIPVTYRFLRAEGLNEDESSRQGSILNLSAGGFCIIGTAEPNADSAQFVGREACLFIEFTREALKVQALCKIRHISPFRQPPSPTVWWNMGMEIIKIQDADVEALKEICAQASIELMKRRVSCRR